MSKNKYSMEKRYELQKLTEPVQLHVILQRPSIYLWELQQELKDMFGLEISAASL